LGERCFELKYGEDKIPVCVPEENLIAVLTGKSFPAITDIPAAVRTALANPIDSPRLDEIVTPGETVAILVSDLTRYWCRSDQFVPVIVDELNRIGVPDQDITVVMAVGTHREQTRAEHAKLVTPAILERVRVVEHHARKSEMVHIGETAAGTPVEINKLVHEADRVILTGGIVHHFLAGYGGGMKSIMPGVSSYRAVMTHHACSISPEDGGGLNDDTIAGKMAGNPFYEEIIAYGQIVNPDFLVNTVMNPDGKIGRVVAGHPIAAHVDGTKTVDEFFNVYIQEQADLVIASCGGFPKDLNFYQSTKSMYNAARTLKPGGTMILLTKSPESFGHPLLQQFITGYPDNVARHRNLSEDYDIGKWVGFLATVTAAKYNIILLSELPDDDVMIMGMTPVNSIEEALQLAYAKLGNSPRTYVMPDAATAFPVMQ
jgi:nickel-dependent lactate racemase